LPALKQPWEVLGLETSLPTRQDVEDAYRRLAMKNHPDRGGDPEEMAKINAARSALLEQL
jgi:curved DNA-binding protein CbpA